MEALRVLAAILINSCPAGKWRSYNNPRGGTAHTCATRGVFAIVLPTRNLPVTSKRAAKYSTPPADVRSFRR